MKADVLAEVQSKTTGDIYEIRKSNRDGVVYCTCMSYRFSKEQPKSCKHLRAYLLDAQGNGGVKAVASPMPALPDGLMDAWKGSLAKYPPLPAPQTAWPQVVPVTKPRAGQPAKSLHATLLAMADKMERGEQVAVSIIVAKFREAAAALQAALPAPVVEPAATAVQPRLGAVRRIFVD